MVRRFGVVMRLRTVARSPNFVPLLLILGAVVVVNLPALIHLVTTNPLVIDAYVSSPGPGVLPGGPYIDPNAGYTTQALGHLAAVDWLHGHVPWWNPYEGAGAPLAGEMQSGAFFPPTLLLAARDGLLWMEMLLEVITGWSTYFLLRRLGVLRSLATCGAVAFGLCGTFAWFAHAPMRPIAFLPLALIGVERALDAARAGRPGGWRLLAVALALSLLAGFPETAFIDGLLVGLWALVRIGRAAWTTPSVRNCVLAKLATGGAVAIGLATPLLVAFSAYLGSANVGGHSGAFAFGHLPTLGLVQVPLPYALGPIFGLHGTPAGADVISLVWGGTGGFLSVTVIAGAVIGLAGRRLRPLRFALAAWIALCLARTFGFGPVLHVMSVLPGVRQTAFGRYANPSWALAAVVLASLGFDDVARRRTGRAVAGVGVGVAAASATWAAAEAWPALGHAASPTGATGSAVHRYAVVSLAGALGALALLTAGIVLATASDVPHPRTRAHRRPTRRDVRWWGRSVIAAAVALESGALFAFPLLSAPPPTPLQLGSVTWLQAHLGSARFYSLAPIQPNYGSYFGIAQVNINDLPSPKSWADYVARQLDPNAPPGEFTGGARLDQAKPTPAEELTTHLAGFEAAGVRYVVESATGADVIGRPFPAPGTPPWPAGPRLVHRDAFAEIWELPDAAPVFTAVAGGATRVPATAATSAGCTVASHGFDSVTVDCDQPATLLRRVQYLAGWTATADGASTAVHPVPGGAFQTVRVPAGRTTVHFAYRPPRATASEVVAIAALAVLVGSWATPAARRARRRRGGGAPSAPDDRRVDAI